MSTSEHDSQMEPEGAGLVLTAGEEALADLLAGLMLQRFPLRHECISPAAAVPSLPLSSFPAAAAGVSPRRSPRRSARCAVQDQAGNRGGSTLT